jgi:hypothetical protein
MKGVFVFLIDGKLETFTDYQEIPETFDHVIKFLPEIPEPPHSEDQHREIDMWNSCLQELVKKEKRYCGY